MKGKEKITGLNAKSKVGTVQKGNPQKAITGNTMSKSSGDKMSGGKKGNMLKAKSMEMAISAGFSDPALHSLYWGLYDYIR